MVGAVSVLRDLNDLAGSAARVVAAAEALDESVRVLVELPDAPGWPAAAELVEAAGLSAQVRAGHSPAALIEQLAALVEADLPFSVAGLRLPGGHPGLPECSVRSPGCSSRSTRWWRPAMPAIRPAAHRR